MFDRRSCLHRHIVLLPALALAALGLAACGSDDAATDAGTTGTVPPGTDSSGADPSGSGGGSTLDLDGASFESTAVDGYDLVEGSRITLGFADGSLSANAGCNTLAGGYTIDGDVLTAGALASTLMACDEALMAQDTWLSGLLTSSPKLALDGDALIVTGADATITMAKQADATIDGTKWVLTGTVANEGVSSLPADAIGSLTITDGQAAVETGCNNGSGSVEMADATLTFSALATTRKACTDELNALEATTLSVLDGEVTWVITGNSLSIRKASADGEIGLEYTAE
jgi:heat shock protein HslJ